MDKIILKNLGFYGYHGVLEAENILGQKFFVDVELGVSLKKARDRNLRIEFFINFQQALNCF